MPIKKLFLEQKLFYRLAKVFFSILPFLVAAVYLKGYINIYDISQKNIAAILQKDSVYIIYVIIGLVLYFPILTGIWRIFLYIAFGGLEDDIEKRDNKVAHKVNAADQSIAPIIIIVVVIALALLYQQGYFKLPRINPSSEKLTHTYGASCTSSNGKTGLYGTTGNCHTCSEGTAVTNPINNNCSNSIAGVYCCGTASNNNGRNNESKCIPTGCGSLWHCSGSYYLGGQQIRFNGCSPLRMGEIYSGWTGVCRQCP